MASPMRPGGGGTGKAGSGQQRSPHPGGAQDEVRSAHCPGIRVRPCDCAPTGAFVRCRSGWVQPGVAITPPADENASELVATTTAASLAYLQYIQARKD